MIFCDNICGDTASNAAPDLPKDIWHKGRIRQEEINE